jgi:hypothetical protein
LHAAVGEHPRAGDAGHRYRRNSRAALIGFFVLKPLINSRLATARPPAATGELRHAT